MRLRHPSPLFAGLLVIGLALALIVTPGLAEKPKPTEAKPAEYTQYFTGQSKVMPPDGNRAYGPPRRMLVKRIVSPEKNQITESVIVGPERFEVTLTRIEQTSKFKLTAKPARYEGTMTFSGKAWHWSSWTYEISFHKQGKLTGTGQLKAGKMTTNKAFFGPDGKQTAVIIDTLTTITENEYRAALATRATRPSTPTPKP